MLAALLPGFAPIFGPCVDILAPDGKRRQKFGNMILSRLKVLEVSSQPLPQPADPAVQHMPRGALWAVVEAPRGPLRIATTHLEFHSGEQRLAQIGALRGFHAEAAANDRLPPLPGPGPYRARRAPIGTVICGDFNFTTDEAPYAAMTAPFADGSEPLVDTWRRWRPGEPQPPTCGIHDRRQWPQGPHARDFAFVSAGLAAKIADVAVDTDTAASDHQPMRVVLAL
jgi:endonuclease/exonuclease/phosphatase family metal-dependent hydrolase